MATDCAADNSEILVLVPTADREAVAQFQARLVASKDKKEVSNGPLGKETVQIKVLHHFMRLELRYNANFVPPGHGSG